MTDSPTPRRHRGSRRAPRRSRGLIGPTVSALSVLLAIGPVVWLMSRDHSTVDDAAKVLNVSEGTRVDSGPSEVDGTTTADVPGATATKTAPNGVVTSVAGTPALGSAASTSTSGTPVTSGTPSSIVTSPTPTAGVTTVTLTPRAPRTPSATRTEPSPSRSTPTKTRTTEPTPSSTTQPLASGGGTNAQERQVLEYTNQIRQQQGCGPLRLDSSLVEAAGKHASDMVRRHYMDHTSPDGKDPGDRMAAAGYRGSSWGENIAAGYDSAQKVVAAWMQSDGHRRNILNCRFTSIGIGYDPGQVRSDGGPGSWVQDFGRS